MSKFRTLYERYILGKNPNQIEMEHLIRHGMKVGKNTTIYSAATIDHGKPYLITIGSNVTISTNVTILTHDASPGVVRGGTKLGRVTIGDNVFIGTGSIVLCNTRIGSNVVVGAGSVVTRDLPDNGVYAGSPAKWVCSIEEYRNKIAALREVRPDFSKILPWNQWHNATEEEKQQMFDGLEDGPGFF